MMVNKGAYIGLCLILGGIGAHKFYSGKWVQGLIYLALCGTGASVVFALLDLLGAIFKRPDQYGQIRV